MLFVLKWRNYMAQEKKKPTINLEGYDLLEKTILAASPAKQGKTHDELVWDECKRYILSCIKHNFLVQ